MKAFKNWIIAHKVLSIIIAAVVTVGAATAIVLPIALKHEHTFATEWSQDGENHWHVCTGKDCDEVKDKAAHVYYNACDTTCNICGATRTVGEHVYDHACDPTCNICGETRTIDVVEMEEWYDNVSIKTKTALSGEAGAQYVIKVPYYWGAEIRLYLSDAEGHIGSDGDAWLVANYDIRIFDEEFNELNVDFGEDDATLAYVYILDAEDNDISESWDGKNVYLMFTIKTAGDNFIITLQ